MNIRDVLRWLLTVTHFLLSGSSSHGLYLFAKCLLYTQCHIDSELFLSYAYVALCIRAEVINTNRRRRRDARPPFIKQTVGMIKSNTRLPRTVTVTPSCYFSSPPWPSANHCKNSLQACCPMSSNLCREKSSRL